MEERRFARRGARRHRPTALLVVLITIFTSAGFLASPASAATPVTYYVSAAGSDGAAGTTPETAWKSLEKVNTTTLQPGDRVLFRSGDSWTGKLTTNGSGSAAARIEYSSFGAGAPPVINGAGALPATINVTASSHLTISNLEITNIGAAAIRNGILIKAPEAGLADISLTDLNIHDVNGLAFRYSIKGYPTEANGAITVTGTAGSSKVVDNLLIEDVDIKNVDDHGVRIIAQNEAARATGVVVRRVSVDNAGGNGILLGNVTDGVVEYSKVSSSGSRSDASAGIWPVYSTRPVIQHNEVTGQTTLAADGFAYDFDWKNTDGIFQYNYSHDNPNGFMQFFRLSTGKVRYNISENDGTAAFGFFNSVSGIEIYNNTIFIAPGTDTKPVKMIENIKPVSTTFRNNLFVNWGIGTYDDTGLPWSNNLFFGNHPASEPSDAAKVVADPRHVAPGARGGAPGDGYRLRPGSPAIGAGTTIANNGGKDFYGNPVSATGAPTIGAFAGTPIAGPTSDLPPVAIDDTVIGSGPMQWNRVGTWGGCNPCAGDPAIGSQFKQSNTYSKTTNASVSMQFTGTRATLYATQGDNGGIAAVSIDGGPEQLVDTYHPVRLGNRPVYTSPVLTAGSHTITVRVTGTKNAAAGDTYLQLDRMDITRIPTRIDDSAIGTTSGTIQYSGSWNRCGPCVGDGASPALFGSSGTWSSAVGATATLRFTGTQATFRAVTDVVHGKVAVSVDGGPESTVDLYSSVRAGQVAVWSTPVLAAGAHTVTVRVLGAKNPASAGTFGTIDSFDFYG